MQHPSADSDLGLGLTFKSDVEEAKGSANPGCSMAQSIVGFEMASLLEFKFLLLRAFASWNGMVQTKRQDEDHELH